MLAGLKTMKLRSKFMTKIYSLRFLHEELFVEETYKTVSLGCQLFVQSSTKNGTPVIAMDYIRLTKEAVQCTWTIRKMHPQLHTDQYNQLLELRKY